MDKYITKITLGEDASDFAQIVGVLGFCGSRYICQALDSDGNIMHAQTFSSEEHRRASRQRFRSEIRRLEILEVGGTQTPQDSGRGVEMGAISALWDSGVLGAMATMAVTTLGQLSALNNQKFTAVLETLQKQQSSDAAVHDSAFARSGDKGVVVRRIMLFMAFFVLAVCPFIFAFFGDIPIAVETVQQSGGWLWGLVPAKETFGVAYINGFYLADVWKELMANLISAYIGAGITRKAFTLGK